MFGEWFTRSRNCTQITKNYPGATKPRLRWWLYAISQLCGMVAIQNTLLCLVLSQLWFAIVANALEVGVYTWSCSLDCNICFGFCLRSYVFCFLKTTTIQPLRVLVGRHNSNNHSSRITIRRKRTYPSNKTRYGHLSIHRLCHNTELNNLLDFFRLGGSLWATEGWSTCWLQRFCKRASPVFPTWCHFSTCHGMHPGCSVVSEGAWTTIAGISLPCFGVFVQGRQDHCDFQITTPRARLLDWYSRWQLQQTWAQEDSLSSWHSICKDLGSNLDETYLSSKAL